MRWVRYHHGGSIHFGILEGDTIAEVDGAPFDKPSRTGVTVALGAARLLPPVIPPTFYAAGINYEQHVRNAAARGLPVQVPKQADIGYRAVNALVGDGAPIVIPADSSGKVQFEGELVVVIGRECKHLTARTRCTVVLWAVPSATTSASGPGRNQDRTSGVRRTPTRSSRWVHGSRRT